MANDSQLIVVVGIVLMFLIPISFYYLGMVAGVNASSMANNLVYLGALLFVLFLAVLVTFGRRK